MEDAGDTASEVVDVEASLNSLKLNDLSTHAVTQCNND